MFRKKSNKTDMKEVIQEQQLGNTEEELDNTEELDNIEIEEELDNTEEELDNTEEETESNKSNNKIKELILYLIIDKPNPTMLEYFRNCGVNVSRIFTNIGEAQDTLLMQVNPVKIVIIDTGSGRLSTMGTRKELLNLMGICDEDARISVYYTDTVLKTEIEYRDNLESRNIHWHKYRSTPDVVAHLLQNSRKEKYIYDDYDKDSVEKADENLLNFKGLTFKETKQIDIGDSSITAHDIIIHMSNNEDTSDEIESYKIRI